ncbi:tropomyosin Tod p 1.0102-like [Actinia tenebrosa]|uniref:Tropomyosin Tod p 1.0102-like n=1 Tax=Actinia tenebrosa TaxID=6105 RepID=A0A6P8I707_ACTTE|nr:tropomyosin Tod p 1.0102-like [Actinia tenebrosa]
MPSTKASLESINALLNKQQEKLQRLETTEEEKIEELKKLPPNSDATGGLMSYLRNAKAEKEALQKEIQENKVTINDLTRQLDEAKGGDIDSQFEAVQEENQVLQGRIEELEDEFMKQGRLTTESHAAEIADFKARLSKLLEEMSAARNQLRVALNESAGKDAELQRLGKELMESVDRERQVMADKAVAEERIRQLRQAVEDLEGQIERQQEISNDQTRSEEEREAAQRELEAL